MQMSFILIIVKCIIDKEEFNYLRNICLSLIKISKILNKKVNIYGVHLKPICFQTHIYNKPPYGNIPKIKIWENLIYHNWRKSGFSKQKEKRLPNNSNFTVRASRSASSCSFFSSSFDLLADSLLSELIPLPILLVYLPKLFQTSSTTLAWMEDSGAVLCGGF